ncbi:hypothetical protein B0J11DRAFT_512347 [Dendryphion nanum]|uniref:Uncharacterized protein n=1 Tax=Dendryphion nanum TaxID=256645 RepID=A0A9P9D1M5_9PLEO|nr:hypothetical protein B0J11DRAFT_512347 [Dendryphion nanum]
MLDLLQLVLALLVLLPAPTAADFYPHNVQAKDMYPNCGTIENRFRMGALLLVSDSDPKTCHALRWQADTEANSHSRDEECEEETVVVSGPVMGKLEGTSDINSDRADIADSVKSWHAAFTCITLSKKKERRRKEEEEEEEEEEDDDDDDGGGG